MHQQVRMQKHAQLQKQPQVQEHVRVQRQLEALLHNEGVQFEAEQNEAQTESDPPPSTPSSLGAARKGLSPGWE